MADKNETKKDTKMIWQSISLLGMLLAPGVLLYQELKAEVQAWFYWAIWF